MSNVCVKNCCIGSGKPKICVPIVAETMRDIFSQARGMQRKQFDIVEWRIDWFEAFEDLNTVRRASRILHGILDDQPFLFTFRTEKEGGKRPISPEYYVELNRVAAQEHLVDMIDFDEAVSAVSRRSTLKTGDIIVLAQPCGRYEARLGSWPRWSIDSTPALGFKIR